MKVVWIAVANSVLLSPPVQFQFRMQALAGELPGVKKASW